MFIKHIKSNAKCHDPYLPETQNVASAGFIMAGKIIERKNMAVLGQNH